MTERASLIQDARRRIKLDAIEDQLEKFRPISLVIPCRENYDFRKDVWDASFIAVDPAQAYAFANSFHRNWLDHIIVACDNEAVQDVLAEFEDERILFHLRQKEETFRSAPLAFPNKSLDKSDPEATGTTLVTYCQAPFVSVGTIEEAISTLAMNDVDSSLGVELINEPIYKEIHMVFSGSVNTLAFPLISTSCTGRQIAC